MQCDEVGNRIRGVLLALLMLAAMSGCTARHPGIAHRTSPEPAAMYRNPVFAHDAPDPTILRGVDGMYYAYTTQSIYLDLLEIPILQSPDLVHWRQVANAFPTASRWVNGGPAGDMWAPHVIYWQRHYLLYFAGRRLDGGDMAIGVGISESPRGPFRDVGHPILTELEERMANGERRPRPDLATATGSSRALTEIAPIPPAASPGPTTGRDAGRHAPSAR